MAMVSEGSPLGALHKHRAKRHLLDQIERELVESARSVVLGPAWLKRRAAAGLGAVRNPIRCRDRQCSCNVAAAANGHRRDSQQHVFTWAEIANALGISRAAAQKRYPDIR